MYMIVNPPYKITLWCMGSATRDLAACSLIISLPYVGLICGATYKCQGICNTKKKLSKFYHHNQDPSYYVIVL